MREPYFAFNTSIMLLQYIAKKFGELVGKGLHWRVIAEFMRVVDPKDAIVTHDSFRRVAPE